MWVDGQEFALKMARSVTDLAQRQLQRPALVDRAFAEQLMDGLIVGDKRQAIDQLETAAVMQRAISANPAGADGGLVNQLQRQTRLDALTRLTRPAAQQIPSAQAQVLGDQQPDPGEVAADLVGQPLTHTAFDAYRIRRSGFAA